MKKNNLTLTALTDYLNSKCVKKNFTFFTVSDVQGYIRRGHLPKYLGGNKIVRSRVTKYVKLYNIVK